MTEEKFNPENMTFSGLKRFAILVDMAMEAEYIDRHDRVRLIGAHAYDYTNPNAIKNMEKGIETCQGYGRVYTSEHQGNQFGITRS